MGRRGKLLVEGDENDGSLMAAMDESDREQPTEKGPPVMPGPCF